MAKHKHDNQHFRDLPCRMYFPQELPEDFRRFYAEQVRDLIALKGYKLNEKHELAQHIIHNLIMAAFPETGVVSDSRDKTNKGIALRCQVWDAVLAAGLADVSVGAENANAVTRYRATTKLLDLREQWELKLVVELKMARNTADAEPEWLALVVLHTGQVDVSTGEPLPESEQRKLLRVPDYGYYVAVENLIERINSSNLDHSWKAFADIPGTDRKRVWQPNVMLRQIHVGELQRGARLYCPTEWSAQSISKADRQSLLIDGEEVCELDFSCMSIRMLYHQHQQSPDGDLYYPERVFPKWHAFRNASAERREVVRDFIKRATNIALNVRSRAAAVGAVTNYLTQSREEPLLRRVLEVETLKVGTLLDRITDEVHAPLNGVFYSERGLELMTTDGKIMLGILREFANAGKPCLPIHDACVVKASDRAFARRVMRETYRTYIGHDPIIKLAF